MTNKKNEVEKMYAFSTDMKRIKKYNKKNENEKWAKEGREFTIKDIIKYFTDPSQDIDLVDRDYCIEIEPDTEYPYFEADEFFNAIYLDDIIAEDLKITEKTFKMFLKELEKMDEESRQYDHILSGCYETMDEERKKSLKKLKKIQAKIGRLLQEK